MVLTGFTDDIDLIQEFVEAVCTSIFAREHPRIVVFHVEQVDQTQIEERKKLHIGIAILTIVVLTLWAYECDPTDYTMSGWHALIAIVTTFILTIANNVLRVIKLYKSF